MSKDKITVNMNIYDIPILVEKLEKANKEIERLNNIIDELHSDLKTLWIVLWNMDTEMTGYQNEIFDKYYDEFHKE